MDRPRSIDKRVVMNVRRPRMFLLMCWLVGSWVGGLALPSVAAQTTQDSNQESVIEKTEGGFLLKTSAGKASVPAPLLNTTVTITISGLIARTTVSQQFSNPSDEWAEGIYVFPLPDHAAVDHLRMRIGERIIEGQRINCRACRS